MRASTNWEASVHSPANSCDSARFFTTRHGEHGEDHIVFSVFSVSRGDFFWNHRGHMKIAQNSPYYCSNIHAGESWAEVSENLATHLPQIRKAELGWSVGIGLRLSAQAAANLENRKLSVPSRNPG